VADRLDYYFRQRVTEAELDLGFELLEKADRNFAADIGVFGVVSGAAATQHAPVADLTIDLSAPCRAYDRLGQRIAFGTAQRVDCAADLTGIPTEVTTSGQERWLGVFLRFKRLLSDPRTDGNSQAVFFRRDESFEIVVRQAPQAAAGSAPKVALVDGELLLCDVRRVAGQSQIHDADIDISRRQAFVFAQGTAVAVTAALWKAIAKTAPTAQAALDSVDGLLAGHFAGTANRHRAQDVDYTPHGFLTSGNLKAALDDLLDALAASSAPAGASRIATRAMPGTPYALPATNVDGHLASLLSWLNAHLTNAANAHAASAIGAAPFAFLASKSVQAQLQELVATLQSVATGQGAALLGSEALGGTPRAVTSTTVHAQLVDLLAQLNAHVGSGDHDGRYLRRIFTKGATLAAGATQNLGTLTKAPDVVTVAYNLLDSLGFPGTPQYFAGPYSASLYTYVDKGAAGGPAVWVRNAGSTKVYVTVNAFVN
jgi:hypothetical protein